MSKSGPPAATAPTPPIVAYAIEHKGNSIYSLVTMSVKGSTVVTRAESQADSLSATLGRLFSAVHQAFTA